MRGRPTWQGVLTVGCLVGSITACSSPNGVSRSPRIVRGVVAPAGSAGRQGAPSDAGAAEDASALGKKLANPIASLISVPLQLNYDTDVGPVDDGERFALNVQPVVPISLSAEWNVISRTILPLVHQDDVFPGAGDQTGLGDVVQSLFFSPVESSPIWGVGPVFLIPTATEEELGGEKWGLGPTGVVLRQTGPWTYGALANHIWSVAGDGDRPDVNATFLQPFLSYTTPGAWTYTLQTESTFDWRTDNWSIPIHALATKVLRIGGQLVSVGGGVRYWADSPSGGAEGFGLRLIVTLLYPR